MKKYMLYGFALLALFAAAWVPVLAQEAPPPRKSPRAPVNREALADRKPAVPTSREIQGQAVIVDGEKLRIGDLDLRLFGVVPPQLSASFGPQARTALDELTAGQTVTCLIRDRDREGRFLATCRNAANADLALELLRRGLAVTARGSVADTDLAASYTATERAAQSQKAGLWSVTFPAPVAVPDTSKIGTVSTSNTPSPVLTDQSRPKLIEEKPVPVVVKQDQNPPKSAETSTSGPRPAAANQVTDDVATADDGTSAAVEEPGFLARYQLLVTGLVMLATALGMLGAISIQRWLERRTEIKAIAAALRGELMAARAVCLARLKTAASAEDKDISWPRIRSTLYQAYVGRLGWLGAELARQVASIYGQSSDYAAYYDGSDDTRASAMPKRQALQTLAQHIEEVLPHLAIIEHTGSQIRVGTELPRPVAGAEPAPERPAVPAANNRAGRSARSTVTRLWTRVQGLARQPFDKKTNAAVQDPIAEYTALIEEEMKRFSFDESEEEPGSLPVNITKLQETA
jgi:endonuclease YncB( thermonuclease family)